MRPDEHKKKKSAQYKKKHGVQASKGEREAHNTRGGKAVGSAAATRPTPGTKQELKNDEPAQTSDGTDIRGGTAEEAGVSFLKRAIQSNWEKYELLDVSSDDDQGADFNVLLSFAGSSSSYKQLDSETEWAEVGDGNSALTIDCQLLAEAFKNLSFCEKYKLDGLGLDEDILEYIGTVSDESAMSGGQLDDTVLSGTIAKDLGFNFSNIGGEKSCELDEIIECAVKTLPNDGEFIEIDPSTVSSAVPLVLQDPESKRVNSPKDLAMCDITANKPGSGNKQLLPSSLNTTCQSRLKSEEIYTGNTGTSQIAPNSTQPNISTSKAKHETNVDTPNKTDQNELDDAELDDLLFGSEKQQKPGKNPIQPPPKQGTWSSPALEPQGGKECQAGQGIKSTGLDGDVLGTQHAKQPDSDPEDLESWLDSVL